MMKELSKILLTLDSNILYKLELGGMILITKKSLEVPHGIMGCI